MVSLTGLLFELAHFKSYCSFAIGGQQRKCLNDFSIIVSWGLAMGLNSYPAMNAVVTPRSSLLVTSKAATIRGETPVFKGVFLTINK